MRFPEPQNIDWYIWRVILSEPPLASLKELQDGTYSISNLADMHEALDIIAECNRLIEGK